jgi:hypothetical protein
MQSVTEMPRAWLRAARLTMRQQRMKPANLAEWAAVFRHKLHHPGRLTEHVRALVEAECWSISIGWWTMSIFTTSRACGRSICTISINWNAES